MRRHGANGPQQRGPMAAQEPLLTDRVAVRYRDALAQDILPECAGLP